MSKTMVVPADPTIIVSKRFTRLSSSMNRSWLTAESVSSSALTDVTVGLLILTSHQYARHKIAAVVVGV